MLTTLRSWTTCASFATWWRPRTGPAGTPWSPYWCPDCDDRRIGRISQQLDAFILTLSAERIANRSPEDIAREICPCRSMFANHGEDCDGCAMIVAALRVERDRFDALLDCVRAEAQCCGCSTRIKQRFDEERPHA